LATSEASAASAATGGSGACCGAANEGAGSSRLRERRMAISPGGAVSFLPLCPTKGPIDKQIGDVDFWERFF
jgi:hypothetical protein